MALVSRIIGKCPGCGAEQAFGNVNVYSKYVFRGCGRCKYYEKVPLPNLKKKVLYLDQFFFSSAFRAKDPKFVEAADRIYRLTANQQLLAPFSNIHEDETHLWENYEELLEFIKKTSGGHRFKPAYRIEQEQLQDAISSWLRQSPIDFDKSDAFQDEIHVWDGYYRIDVNVRTWDRELIRDSKGAAVDGLISILPEWRKSTDTFEQDLDTEAKASANGYLRSYLEYRQRLENGDFSAFWNAPLISKVVQGMIYAQSDEIDLIEKFKNVVNFFQTENFKNVPRQDIENRIFATLKMLVVQGAFQNVDVARKKLSGFFYDVSHIATYAPYCDAIMVDAPMHEILGREQVGLETRYGVKVFSIRNWPEMLDWFDEIEASMTEEHREALALAYM